MIKFRGFHPDDNETDYIVISNKTVFGKWIYGYYVCLNNNTHRIYTGYAEKDCKELYPEYYEIIPETIGQGIVIDNQEFYEGDDIEVDRNGEIWVVHFKNIRHIPNEIFGSSVNSRKIVGNLYKGH